jgi:molybdate transport system substrate-binding protein
MPQAPSCCATSASRRSRSGGAAGRRAFIAGAVALLTLAALPAKAADKGKITVFAAASLHEAFDAAAAQFTGQTGIAVTFSYGGSDALAAQIAQGAPADVFASANVKQMQKVADAGALAAPAQTFARNRLVIIVPNANPGKVAGLADLARPGVRVVLAAPDVPVGNYARTAFAKLAGSNGLPADFTAAVEKNVVSNELDVKAVATKIALGEGDAGVVYVTDVTSTIASSVHVIDFPPGGAPEATYPIAVLKSAPNADGARAFVAFVLHDGQAFLKERGFLAP